MLQFRVDWELCVVVLNEFQCGLERRNNRAWVWTWHEHAGCQTTLAGKGKVAYVSAEFSLEGAHQWDFTSSIASEGRLRDTPAVY